MTTIHVSVNHQDDAVISCPDCHRSKHTRLTRFKRLGRPLKVKCACGSAFGVALMDHDETASLQAYGQGAADGLATIPPSSYAATNGATDTEQSHRLSFHGEVAPLFRLDMAKRFLGCLTAGLYHFWGRTKIRTYLVNHTAFDGECLVYQGSGKELLSGWLKAILIFALLTLLVPLAFTLIVGRLLGAPSLAGLLTAISLSLLNQLLIPMIMVNARRYRLSHTSWRGIRFSFRGQVRDFLAIYLKGVLLTTLTLGLYYPYFATQRQAFMMANTYYGNRPFDFDGFGQDLFGSYLRVYLLSFLLPVLYWILPGNVLVKGLVSLITAGLLWSRFFAEKQRYFWDHTCFGSARFHAAISDWDFMILKAVNVLLLVLTLSFGWAWVKVRTLRFTFHRLTLEGSLDLDGIQPEDDMSSPVGEGLASFLEMELDLG